jgi:single-strand DNA-binding protein
MANLNKVMLIGRLTRDPDPITTGGQTSGAKFGFAVNNRKMVNGEWKDVPVWIDCEIWNRGENKQADRVLNTLRKGAQVYLEGHLKLDEWEDKNGGGKRTALRVVVETFQYLDAKQEGEQRPVSTPRQQQPAMARSGGNSGGGNGGYSRNGGGGGSYNGGGGHYDDDGDYAPPAGKSSNQHSGGNDDDIPF